MCVNMYVCVQVRVKKRCYTLISLSFEYMLKIWFNHVSVIKKDDLE